MPMLYHASPAYNRPSILRSGLTANRQRTEALWRRTRSGRQPRGNYGYEDLPAARAFAYGGIYERHGISRVDVWRFDATDLDVRFDPELRLMHGVVDGALSVALRFQPWARTPPRWYVTHSVEPARLELAEMLLFSPASRRYTTRGARKISLASARGTSLPTWPSV